MLDLVYLKQRSQVVVYQKKDYHPHPQLVRDKNEQRQTFVPHARLVRGIPKTVALTMALM